MKGWATVHIAKLQRGETVQFRPQGKSMVGRVNDGQLVTVAPVEEISDIDKDDVVLCLVGGSQYLHKILQVKTYDAKDGVQYLIGNNRGGINGWCPFKQIYGRLIKVED